MVIETITRVTLDPIKEQKVIRTMEKDKRMKKVSESTTAVIFEHKKSLFTEGDRVDG